MSRIKLTSESKAQNMVARLYGDLMGRVESGDLAMCPVDFTASFIKLCHSQTCGKCVPCRVGLGQLATLMEKVLDGEGDYSTLDAIERTALAIYQSADCAVGYEAANMVLRGLKNYKDDFISHIESGNCISSGAAAMPCVTGCPAEVDIPGYISLIADKRYNDAVRLIRKDNPFVTACALVCEHPCETKCRRSMVDDAINIRGLKRYAIDHASKMMPPACAESTGKTVAVIGGGPAGLTAAYYLQLMGHQVTVYEQRDRLGGMLLYGIPNYRLPKDRLDDDIDYILSSGVKTVMNFSVGNSEGQTKFSEIKNKYDAVFIAIGAHTDKKLGIEGENADGVFSAVEMLRDIGHGKKPDFTGKRVVVIGGGNVAMDVTRSSIRLGADCTTVLYRRRKSDMTALSEEIEGAIAEGAEIMELHAPESIATDKNGKVTGVYASPKIIGTLDDGGRPRPADSGKESVLVPCDIVIVAIGQDIVSGDFESEGIPVRRGKIVAGVFTNVSGDNSGVFSGGDCVTGPATVIKAIASGKVAAANIDAYLGFSHEITTDIDVPTPHCGDRLPCGRVTMREREAFARKDDFEICEIGMTDKEAMQEALRCLRCDHFGCGSFKGGRVTKW